jgi:hypothetical protein
VICFDASRKAQLIVFMYTLLGKKQPTFPQGYTAFMVYEGIQGTYVYDRGWQRLL